MDEIREDIQLECEEKLGPVNRIRIFEVKSHLIKSHPDGIVEIKFVNAKDAEECIKLMNGRIFDGKEVKCGYWDGKVNFKV